MPSDRVSRREIIKRIFFYAGLTPFLSYSSLLPGISRQRRKRFVALFSACGQQNELWYPNPAVTNNFLAQALRLSSISGDISPVLGAGFKSLRDKLTLIRGLDIVPLKVRDHWPAKMLTGYGDENNPHLSIDQVMANSSAVYPTTPKLRSLNLKVEGIPGCATLRGATISVGNIAGKPTPINPTLEPFAAYRQLFAPTGIIPDAVKDQLLEVSRNPHLSQEDKHKLRDHLEFIFETERSVGQIECKDVPDLSSDPKDILKGHMDLILAAIKCGFTNIAALTMTEAADERRYNFLSGVGNGFHQLTHTWNDDSTAQLRRIYLWFGEMVAYFLNQLNTPEDSENGETYLDNSVVYWGSEQAVKYATHTTGLGNMHDSIDMPVLLAGSAGGYLKTGYFHDFRTGVMRGFSSPNCTGNVCYSDPSQHPSLGRPLNELLITLMMAMGLRKEEWEQGSAGFGDYSGDALSQYKFGDRRSPIAEIVA